MPDYNLGTARGKVQIDSSDIREASRDLKNADIVLTQTGQSLIHFGTQALRAFGYVVNVAREYEKNLDFIQAVTRGTDKEIAKLSETAIELGKKGPFGPIALTEAFVELAKAGITAKEVTEGIGGALVNLAAAADITTQEAGEIIVQTKAIFGLMAKEVPHAVDLIAGAANASQIDVSDFATTLKYVGPVAAATNMSLEDTATTIALLGQSGIKGSQAGTSLRQMILNLSGATPKAIERMRELGIVTEDGSNRFYDATGRLKGMDVILGILNKSMKDLTERQRADALRDIFGVRQLPTALFLMKEATKGWREMNEEVLKTTAADVAAERLDNLDGAIARFKATLEAVLLGPSSEFQQTLKEFVLIAREILLWFDRLPGPVKTFLVGAVGVVGVMALLSGAFLLTIGTIVRAVRVFGELSRVALALGPMLRNAAAGARALTFALATNPIILIAGALILLGVAVFLAYKRFKVFRDFVDRTWQGIQRAWDSLTDTFVNFWHGIQEFFRGASSLGGLWNSFVNAFNRSEGITTNLKNIHGWLERLGARLASAWEFAQRFWDSFIRGATGFAQALRGAVVRNLDRLIDGLSQLPRIIGRTLTRAMTRFGDIVTEALGAAIDASVDFVQNFPRNIGRALGFVIGRYIRFGFDLLRLTVRIFTEVVTTTIRLLGQFATIFFDVLENILGFMITWGGRLLAAGIRIAIDLVTGIIQFVARLPAMFQQVLTAVFQALVSSGPGLLAQAISIGTNILQGIMQFVLQLPGQIAAFFGQVLSFLIGFIGQALSVAGQIGQAILDGLIGVITTLPDLVWGIFQNVLGVITDVIGAAWDAAYSFGKGLWEGFKSGLGIGSPSFIEHALFAIQDEAAKTATMLRRSVDSMGLTAKRMPMNFSGSTFGLSTPSDAAARGNMTSITGPLIGTAVIREEADIYKLAKALDQEQRRKERSAGVKK